MSGIAWLMKNKMQYLLSGSLKGTLALDGFYSLIKSIKDRRRGPKKISCCSIIRQDILYFITFFRALDYSPYTQRAIFVKGVTEK
jgi:hypothetical protein